MATNADFKPSGLAAAPERCEPISCRRCGVYHLCLPLGLEQPDMSLLNSIVRRKEVYKRGQVLFRSGDQLDYVYAIRAGSVKTSVYADDGRVQITGFHIPGDVLGLGSLASDRYTSEARALETISVCKVSFGRFQAVARQTPSLQYQMLRIMSNEIRRNEELLLLLGKRTAEERLAEFLINLSRRHARRNYSASEFRLSMSRSEIGSHLGIAEETVCRVLKRFQDEGMIAAVRRNVRLIDVPRLRARAHLDIAA